MDMFKYNIVIILLLFIHKIKTLEFVKSFNEIRKRRSLIYISGTTVELDMAVNVPIEGDSNASFGPEWETVYQMPDNSSLWTGPDISTIERRRRELSGIRWKFYNTLAHFSQRFGLGGKSCILQTICEIAEMPFDKNMGVFEELLHTLFTPSSTHEEITDNEDNEYRAAEFFGKSHGNCKYLFPECSINYLEEFTKLK